MSRSDAFVWVECDKEGCNEQIEVQLTALAGRGWDDRNVDGSLRHWGWEKWDGKDICDSCVERDKGG